MPSETQPVDKAISVFIYGHNQWGEPVKEIAKALATDANGGLVELAAPVSRRYALLAMNMATGHATACRVASVQMEPSGKALVDIRFVLPSPDFWGLELPPKEEDPAARKSLVSALAELS